MVAGATKAAGDAAPDAYNSLKALIKGKFAGKPTAEMVLKEHETDPETYKKPLEKELAEAGADKDEEIIQMASNVLEQVEKEVDGKQITQHVSNVKYAVTAASGNASIGSITEQSTS